MGLRSGVKVGGRIGVTSSGLGEGFLRVRLIGVNGLVLGLQLRARSRVYRELKVDEDPDVIVAREVELAEAVVRESGVDHRAKVEVVLPSFVAPAYFPEDGVLVWVLAVYREVCGALETVLARRPAVGRERFYARERDRLPIDDSIHPRDLERQVAR